jgi:membrane-bound serine protease (ClpP class)
MPRVDTISLSSRNGEAPVWIVASVLLGLVLLACLAGLHTGPHALFGASGLGVVAAAWLVVTAMAAGSASLAWTLFGVDVAVVGVTAAVGLRGLKAEHGRRHAYGLVGLEGAEGVAVSDLRPQGLVKVRSQTWSARAINGDVPAGTPVQVIKAEGLRLEVWGEHVGPSEEEVTQ